MDHLDMLANSIDGINKGYKQIRKMLEIGIHEFQTTRRISNLNGNQLLRIYALSKNDIQRAKLKKMGFGDQEMQRINDLLPKEAREFADKVVQYFSTSYYESVNSIYSYLNDVNLQYVPNYFPTITESKSVGAQELLDGNFNGIFNAENAPALKERSDTQADIDILKDFTSVVESHFQAMEKYKSFAHIYRQGKSTEIRPWLTGFLLLLAAIIFLPWTQNIRSKGNITSLFQEQRPQKVYSPIAGKISRWWVKEGDFVKKGDTLAKITEIKEDYLDPNLVPRTQEQLNAKKSYLEFYEKKYYFINGCHCLCLKINSVI
jgi:biotin carboxyl carrier protein